MKKFNFIKSRHDTLSIISTYYGINHNDIVVRKFLPDSVKFTNKKDIGISNLAFPPEVKGIYLPNCTNGSGLRFDSLKITIQNYSPDTIHSLEIDYDLLHGSSQCHSWQRTWMIDSIQLLPFDSITIDLDSFSVGCVNLYDKKFCLWVSTPNGETDVVPSNDLFCGEVNLLINTNEEQGINSIMVKPNPATDLIQIEFPEIFIGGHINIYNLEGVRIQEAIITEEIIEHSIIDYAPGLYFIQLVSNTGIIATDKVVILH